MLCRFFGCWIFFKSIHNVESKMIMTFNFFSDWNPNILQVALSRCNGDKSSQSVRGIKGTAIAYLSKHISMKSQFKNLPPAFPHRELQTRGSIPLVSASNTHVLKNDRFRFIFAFSAFFLLLFSPLCLRSPLRILFRTPIPALAPPTGTGPHTQPRSPSGPHEAPLHPFDFAAPFQVWNEFFIETSFAKVSPFCSALTYGYV